MRFQTGGKDDVQVLLQSLGRMDNSDFNRLVWRVLWKPRIFWRIVTGPVRSSMLMNAWENR